MTRCGNGLLTHILTTEGYEGMGVDLRARTSWDHYPPSTQACLRVYALDPTTLPSSVGLAEDDYLKPGVFIIGNHADELTPWVPVLSTIHSASGYLSIPCCAWTFDMRYERSSTAPFPVPTSDFPESLNLGGDGSNNSSYSMYRIWLASLSLHCGWEVECDVLRIPSTRNWAIVGEFLLFIIG
jgi:tRNASer (uridine44-2'-O)-methyltransferase